MAEVSVSEVVSGLWSNISTIIGVDKISRPNSMYARSHFNDFKNGIPAHNPVCLGDIINGGWSYYRELQQSRLTADEVSEKTDHLNEMLLKSIEVLEFKRRTG
jgi:hypothetical protein